MLMIGKQLRQLRKDRDITQEHLAGFLGVSPQAISKWERGEGYPDITLLPTLATFFNITLDELMGMAQIKAQHQISEIEAELKKNGTDGKIEENIRLLRKALLTFPNHYPFMVQLAVYLPQVMQQEALRIEAVKEGIELLERVLQFCTDTIVCMEAQTKLCLYYGEVGEDEKAQDLAKRLPSIWNGRELVMTQLLKGEERGISIQSLLSDLVMLFINHTTILATDEEIEDNVLQIDKKVRLLEKNNQLIQLLCEAQDYHFFHVALSSNNWQIASVYLQGKRTDEAITYLEKAIEHAQAFDGLPEQVAYTSILLDKLVYHKESLYKSTPHTLCEVFQNGFEAAQFDDIRDEPRFIVLREQIKGEIADVMSRANKKEL